MDMLSGTLLPFIAVIAFAVLGVGTLIACSTPPAQNTAKDETGMGIVPHSASGNAASPTIDSTGAAAKIKNGAVVIDVRTASEFAGGHVDKAANISVQELASKLDEVRTLVGGDLSKPIVVYCAAGRRAASAQQILMEAGFTNITNGGGFSALSSALSSAASSAPSGTP